MKKIWFIAIIIVALSINISGYCQSCSDPNSILSVKKRKSGKTEYVIFTLKNPATTSISVTTTQPPFTEDGSGNTVTIAGCKFKQVKFDNVVWTCAISENFTAPTYTIKKVKKTGQFEGIITYVIGYRCNNASVVSYSYTDGGNRKFVVRFKY